jgi:predicted nucleic acid-binding protein
MTQISLVWSYVLDYEASFNPFEDRRQVIESWRYFSKIRIMEDESVIALAEPYIQRGVKSFDALHVACAKFANATQFITTDDRLLSKIRDDKTIKAVNPLDALAYLEKWYEE